MKLKVVYKRTKGMPIGEVSCGDPEAFEDSKANKGFNILESNITCFVEARHLA